ncbi:MAG: uroporphyrinogen-III synthase [Frankiaceae bacterium]
MDGPGAATAEVPPLAGFTVGVTAARRSEELCALLERRGAAVVAAPAMRLVPLPDDDELLRATKTCLAEPPEVVVVTTGIGFRGWMEAADGWGLGESLRDELTGAELLARGPKARGAIRASGLRELWSPDSESVSEVLDKLLERDLAGVRIAVQLHGEPLPDVVDALSAAGAEVVPVPVYRWAPPVDPVRLRRIVDAVVARQLDAVTFTSAPAVCGTLESATEAGCRAGYLDSLRTHTVAACVGPVTAAPLQRLGVPVVMPDRSRLGALVRELCLELPARRARVLPVAGCRLELRGSAVLVDGMFVALPPAPLAVLRALAEQPGRVLSRAQLRTSLPRDGSDAHAVEMAVARLRGLLGNPRIVQTVVKRGYRLAYEPEQGSGTGACS